MNETTLGLSQFGRINAVGEAVELPTPVPLRQFLREGEAVHRELRGSLPTDYCNFMAEIFSEDTLMTQLVDEGSVRAIALWRVFQTTYCGRRLEIDDLVTADADRSRGYGAVLLEWIEARGRELGCPTLTLNSATHRRDAHRFYFRQHYGVIAFHFSKDLTC